MKIENIKDFILNDEAALQALLVQRREQLLSEDRDLLNALVTVTISGRIQEHIEGGFLSQTELNLWTWSSSFPYHDSAYSIEEALWYLELMAASSARYSIHEETKEVGSLLLFAGLPHETTRKYVAERPLRAADKTEPYLRTILDHPLCFRTKEVVSVDDLIGSVRAPDLIGDQHLLVPSQDWVSREDFPSPYVDGAAIPSGVCSSRKILPDDYTWEHRQVLLHKFVGQEILAFTAKCLIKS